MATDAPSAASFVGLRHMLGRPKPTWKGISQRVLDEAGVTVDNDGIASIPCRSHDGSLLRMRYWGNAHPWWGEGEGQFLFGLEQLPPPGSVFPPYCALIFAEGESDALAARQFFTGYEDDVAVRYFVLGVPGAQTFDAAWRIVAEPFDVVYAIGDGDQAGHEFIWSVRKAIPWTRVAQCPEGRDLRDLLQRGDADVFLSLLREADDVAVMRQCFFTAPDYATAVEWLQQGGPPGVGA